MKVWDLILGLLSILSVLLAVISEEYRILAFTVAFVLFIILIISNQGVEISRLKFGQEKLAEKLKIHEQLIDIKSELKRLQKEVELIKK